MNTHTHEFSTKSNDALQQQKSRIRYLSVIIHCSFCAAIFVITCHRVDKKTDRTYKNETHRTPATTTKLVQSIAYELLSHFGQRNGNFVHFIYTLNGTYDRSNHRIQNDSYKRIVFVSFVSALDRTTLIDFCVANHFR